MDETSAGNIIKGFDDFFYKTQEKRKSSALTRISHDRLFSNSSMTWVKVFIHYLL